MTRYIIFLVSANANLPTCLYDTPKIENFEKIRENALKKVITSFRTSQ